MTPRELERLEAEAEAQRRRLAESWDNLQDAVPGRNSRRVPRAHLRAEEIPSLTGKIIDFCLFAVAAGCVIEIYRRIQQQSRQAADGSQKRRLMSQTSKGAEKWKTHPTKKPRKALPAKKQRALLPKRANVRALLPDLTTDPRQIN